MLLSPKKFYNKYAEIYDRGIDSFELLNENNLRRELVKKYIAKGSKVLDLGCGTGVGYSVLKDIVGKYIGIDFSNSSLNIANIKLQNEITDGKAEFRFGSLLEKLEYPNESFDGVVSFYGSCSHLVEKNSLKKLTREVYRVLKPNSYAIIDILYKYSLDRILHNTYNINACSLTWAGSRDITQAKLYTPSSARKLFQKSGFKVESIIGVTILADRNLPFRKIFNKYHQLGHIEFNIEGLFNLYFPFNALAHALIVVAYKN